MVADGEHGDLLTQGSDDPPAPAVITEKRTRPLEGLKVVDLAWVVAGPAVGRVLADYGAEVVRVESSKRVDTARVMGPFPGGNFNPQRSALYDNCNSGKLGLALDLRTDESRDVIHDLAAWGDVLIESFAPGQMARWGLGFDALHRINPRLLMLSTSLMGQTGPFSAFAGYGNIGAAVSGYQNIVGWPDANPIGPFGPYTDYIGPRLALVALLGGLSDWRGNQNGRLIDVSQAECGIQFLSPEIALCAATGENATATGNRVETMSPHGVFPCKGDDRWMAIAIRDDFEWKKLAGLIQGEALNDRFAALADRKRHEDDLEALVANWTQAEEAEALQEQLQTLGLASHIASASVDIVTDPQLEFRDHFVRLTEPQGEDSVIEARSFKLSDTPATYERTAPTFGRDTDFVLQTLLDYKQEEIDRLRNNAVLI